MANTNLCHCPYSAANLAPGGAAVASTTFNYDHRPSRANDGSDETHDGNYGSCFVSQVEKDPWWRLDLGGLFDISTIELLRRTDACGEDLNLLEIRIGISLENNGNNNPRWSNGLNYSLTIGQGFHFLLPPVSHLLYVHIGYFSGVLSCQESLIEVLNLYCTSCLFSSLRCAVVPVSTSVKMTFHCNQKQVRYINIFRPGSASMIQVCEVKVFAATTGGNKH